MSSRTRERHSIENPDAPLQEAVEEQKPLLQFATIQQVTILQDQMSTIMEILQRMTALPYTSEVPLTTEVPPAVVALPIAEVLSAVKILPSETIQTHQMISTSCYSIPANWESILNKKFDKAITRRKNIGRPISIKEDPFIEDKKIKKMAEKNYGRSSPK
ncbi:hypothetical protein Fot_35210 [Forsythia ovata]|uniref:Uncharacterized protein n=1 Tax=Forsythia ovata TaxID=205694 RepID=A0ABD1SKW1_9LAMI